MPVPEDKRALLEAMLERGMVLVTLDARRPGVIVPERLAGDPALGLNLSWRFGLPMELGEWGVRATLTFGGVPIACSLPWNAIWAVRSHKTPERYVFEADVPDDSLLEVDPAERTPQAALARPLAAGEPPPLQSQKRPSPLRLAEGPTGADLPAPDPETPPPAPPAGGRPSHLKLVK